MKPQRPGLVGPGGEEWPCCGGDQEHAIARHDGTESGPGGAGGRLSGLMRSDELDLWLDGEAEGEPLPGEARGRPAQERYAAGVTLSHVYLPCHRYPLEDDIK